MPKLWELLAVTDGRVPDEVMCNVTHEIAHGLFPENYQLATYASLAGRKLFWDETNSKTNVDSRPLPENLTAEMLPHWLAGQMMVAATETACALNEVLGEPRAEKGVQYA